MARMTCEQRLFLFIYKFKLLIIIFWILAGIASSFWALSLTNYTLFQFLPPSGTQSQKAYNMVSKYFPSFLFQDIEIILVTYDYNDHLPNGSINDYKTILNPITKDLCQKINETMYNDVDPNGEMLESITQLYQFNVTNELSSHPHDTNPNNPLIAPYTKEINKYIYESGINHLVSSNEKLMVILLTLNVDGYDQEALNNYISKIQTNLKKILTKPKINENYVNMYDITLTGGLTIFQEAMTVIKNDITSRDLIVLPFIFAFMIYIIGSWKLIMLPGITLGLSIVISFGTYVPFAKYYLDVNPLAPTIMMFLSMALSVDYSLFLLSRFANEREKGQTVEYSVQQMLSYSGHVVVLSGIVLIICYLGLGFFPVSGMNTAGYGAIISIFYCIVINTTLTSSIILQFNNFFGKLEIIPLICFENCFKCCQCCCLCTCFCCKRWIFKKCCMPLECYYYNQRIGYTYDASHYNRFIYSKHTNKIIGIRYNSHNNLSNNNRKFHYSMGVPMTNDGENNGNNNNNNNNNHLDSSDDISQTTNDATDLFSQISDDLESSVTHESKYTGYNDIDVQLYESPTMSVNNNDKQDTTQNQNIHNIQQQKSGSVRSGIVTSNTRHDHTGAYINTSYLASSAKMAARIKFTSSQSNLLNNNNDKLQQTPMNNGSLTPNRAQLASISTGAAASPAQQAANNSLQSWETKESRLNAVLRHNSSISQQQQLAYINASRMNTSNIDEHKKVSQFYFKMTQYTTKFPCNIIVPLIIYAAMIPVIYQLCQTYDPAIDFTMNFPTNTAANHAYNKIVDNFDPAMLNTLYLLAVPTTNDHYDTNTKTGKFNGTVWNDNYFYDICNVTRSIMSGMGMNSTEFQSIVFEPKFNYNATTQQLKINTNDIQCNKQSVIYDVTHHANKYHYTLHGVNNSNLTLYLNSSIYYQYYIEYFYNNLVNSDETAMLIDLSVNFNPWVGSSKQHLKKLRNIVNEFDASTNVTNFYLHSTLYWQLDSLNETYDRLWWVAGLICIIVFLFIGISFRAIILPFRLFLCVVIPILFVYGVANGIYENGWLDDTFIGNWNALHSTNGIYWILPVVTMTILIGFAMDYEIFLFSRIEEYHKKCNYTNNASIILGVASTGPIISSAGTVMALAFFGLLLQNIIASNQMGFVMTLGVLVDTFIIRPLLVPSILSLGGILNFWPAKVPKTQLKNEYGQIVVP